MMARGWRRAISLFMIKLAGGFIVRDLSGGDLQWGRRPKGNRFISNYQK